MTLVTYEVRPPNPYSAPTITLPAGDQIESLAGPSRGGHVGVKVDEHIIEL